VPESDEETWKELDKIIDDLSAKLELGEKLDYDDINRLGRNKPGKCRPILMKLVRKRDKKLIMAQRKCLKGTNIYIQDDLTPDERAEYNTPRSKFKELKDQHPDASVKLRTHQILMDNRIINDNLFY